MTPARPTPAARSTSAPAVRPICSQLAAELELETRLAEPRAGEIQRSCLDPSTAHTELGWQARTSLREGLRATLAAAAG